MTKKKIEKNKDILEDFLLRLNAVFLTIALTVFTPLLSDFISENFFTPLGALRLIDLIVGSLLGTLVLLMILFLIVYIGEPLGKLKPRKTWKK